MVDSSLIRLSGAAGGGRYSYPFADGSESEMVYVEQRSGVVTITHTETPRRHQGHGVAAALVGRAVEDFRAAEKKVIPACSFARAQFREHPEWADLLFRG